jgi:predicted transglutaminase-like cysteine proteinase
MAFRWKFGLCLGVAISFLPLGTEGFAVENNAPRTAPLHRSAKPLPDDGPRFFTIRQLIAKQRGESVPVSATRRGIELAGSADLSETLGNAVRNPFSSRGFEMFASVNEAVSEQWKEVQLTWSSEKKLVERCDQSGRCQRSASIMTSISRQAVGLEGMEQLRLVNARVNAAVRYRSDFSQHGVNDLWSAPLGTLGRAGDCEDYVIAKFFILLGLGIPEDDMRIVLVRDRRAREDHAVLAVKGEFGWHLLDNRNNAIESDQNMAHYRPMFALNSMRMEMFAAPYAEADDPDLKGAILPASAGEPDAEFEMRPELRGILD